MTSNLLSRGSAVMAVVALVAALGTVTPTEPADAVTFNLRSCGVSAGNGAYSYYWSATDSTDYDCIKVGAAFASGTTTYDATYPYNADKVSVSEPTGGWSVHKPYDPYGHASRIVSYTW